MKATGDSGASKGNRYSLAERIALRYDNGDGLCAVSVNICRRMEDDTAWTPCRRVPMMVLEQRQHRYACIPFLILVSSRDCQARSEKRSGTHQIVGRH